MRSDLVLMPFMTSKNRTGFFQQQIHCGMVWLAVQYMSNGEIVDVQAKLLNLHGKRS